MRRTRNPRRTAPPGPRGFSRASPRCWAGERNLRATSARSAPVGRKSRCRRRALSRRGRNPRPSAGTGSRYREDDADEVATDSEEFGSSEDESSEDEPAVPLALRFDSADEEDDTEDPTRAGPAIEPTRTHAGALRESFSGRWRRRAKREPLPVHELIGDGDAPVAIDAVDVATAIDAVEREDARVAPPPQNSPGNGDDRHEGGEDAARKSVEELRASLPNQDIRGEEEGGGGEGGGEGGGGGGEEGGGGGRGRVRARSDMAAATRGRSIRRRRRRRRRDATAPSATTTSRRRVRRSIADAVAYAVDAEEEDDAEGDAGVIHDPDAPTPSRRPSPSPSPSRVNPSRSRPSIERRCAPIVAVCRRRLARVAEEAEGRARRIIAAIAARTARTKDGRATWSAELEADARRPSRPVAPRAVASPALAAIDALDAAVRASPAAVRASVKDAGAHERAAVVARLAPFAPTMRLTTEVAAGPAPPPRFTSRRTSTMERSGGRSGLTATARARRRRRRRGSSVGI